MLETGKDRVEFLKAGYDERTIERQYIAGNDIRIINGNLLFIGKEMMD